MLPSTTQSQSSPEHLPRKDRLELISQVEPDQYVHQIFMEHDSPSMAQEAWRIHAEGYLNMRFVNEGAITSEGYLTSDIDKARGKNVEYMLALNPDNGDDCASMRKIHVAEGQDYKSLPAYNACAEKLHDIGAAQLDLRHENGQNIKEISALAKTKAGAPRAIFELFRSAIHGAMGKDEVFFFSMVSATHEVLTPRLGDDNFLVIGEDVAIDDPRVEPGIKLRPLLTIPDQFNDNILKALNSADTAASERRLAQSLIFYTDGLNQQFMSDEVRQARYDILRSFGQKDGL